MGCCEGCKCDGKDATLGDLLRDAANDLAGASIRLDAVSDKLYDLGTERGRFFAGNADAYMEQLEDLTKRIKTLAEVAPA